MKAHKISVKDVKAFIKSEIKLYATSAGKAFYVKLHAGPSALRYVVEVGNNRREFGDCGEAVKYYNDN